MQVLQVKDREMDKEDRELKKSLRTLSHSCFIFLRQLDEVMKGPSTPERGQKIAKLSNYLEMANDTVRRFALDMPISAEAKDREWKLSRRGKGEKMRLEDIGFYTLSDYRASQCSQTSPLWRCELILTDRCNFKCVYCRGLRSDCKGDMGIDRVYQVLDNWISHGLKNIRFSGGEPTLYPYLREIIAYCKGKMEHIAISTNGSASLDYYNELIDVGVNDMSISLDSGCCSIGDTMAGGISGAWEHTTAIIKAVSRRIYVSVGMVFTEKNINTCVSDVLYADILGVSDIRVIPSAQYNRALAKLKFLPENIINKYPILKYRVNNLTQGIPFRGVLASDTHKCPLVLDDMAIAGNWHFPCIIYLREGGNPIGNINSNMRAERNDWYNNHNSEEDPICKRNCLDVCRDYNNKAMSMAAVG